MKKYNTPLSEHNVALVFKADAEAFLFVIKSSLDCLANFLDERFVLPIDKVYFNYELQRQLAEDKGGKEKDLRYTISCLIVEFLNDNDYLFKLRNLAAHNAVIKADYALGPQAISASSQEISGAANVPANRKVDNYGKEIIERLYRLSGRIFDKIVS